MVYEAVDFLDMKEKDRIGHATSIGVKPELWINKMGTIINMKQGEWLDNLIFSYLMIDNEKEYCCLLYKIEQEIKKYFYKIYKQKNVSIINIINAYKMRKIDPFYLFNEDYQIINPIDNVEKDFQTIIGFEYEKIELKLLKDYHNYNTYLEYNKKNRCKIRFF